MREELKEVNWYCSLDTQVINHLIEKKNHHEVE